MFEIGDRVEFVSGRIIDGNKYLVNGATGTVVHIHPTTGMNNIGVEWDEGRNELTSDPNHSTFFHSCNGHCSNGTHGWYVGVDDIVLVEEFDFNQEIQIESEDLFTLF